jgi:hypothetical protein
MDRSVRDHWRCRDDRRAPRRIEHLAGRDRREATGEEVGVMKGDEAVEQGAEKLQQLSDKAASKGGVTAKVSGPLADDAQFLRKLKPSLIVRRAKGELPRDAEPGSGAPAAPSGPQHAAPLAGAKKGPSPFVVAGAAFGAGALLAKIIDWRGHAHPRR